MKGKCDILQIVNIISIYKKVVNASCLSTDSNAIAVLVCSEQVYTL